MVLQNWYAFSRNQQKLLCNFELWHVNFFHRGGSNTGPLQCVLCWEALALGRLGAFREAPIMLFSIYEGLIGLWHHCKPRSICECVCVCVHTHMCLFLYVYTSYLVCLSISYIKRVFSLICSDIVTIGWIFLMRDSELSTEQQGQGEF
jgi:hypothetical protein